MRNLMKWQQLFCPEKTPVDQVIRFKSTNIFIKRDDLNHPVIQGNKLRKLKYNLKHAIDEDYSCVATFGGAWSNHIVATAKATQLCGLKSIGFIRGDELKQQQSKWSQSLKKASQYGMELIFLSRFEYKEKEQAQSVKEYLLNTSESIFMVPEGGSNELALKGVVEIIVELKQQINQPTHIITACGTGGTMAGLIDGIAQTGWKTTVIGIPVLKGVEYLNQEVEKFSNYHDKVNWQLYFDYHAGGYAKTNEKISRFAKNFSNDTHIPLDKVYTSKSFYAVYDLITKGDIAKHSNIVILHTGGLQGGITV